MEHPLVIGILNIVEDKLREFNISIPDEFGDTNENEPLTGYHYAELHDRIMEFLEEQCVIDPYTHQTANSFKTAAPTAGDLDSVKDAVYGLLESLDEPYDKNSVAYKKAVSLTYDLCFHSFPDLHDSIFGFSDYDMIFYNSEGEYTLYYYNPDSVSGGQIVECYFDDNDVKQFLDGEDYIDILSEHTQYLNDIDTNHFFKTVFNLIDAKNNGEYLGNSFHQFCHDIQKSKTASLDSMIRSAHRKTKPQCMENQLNRGGIDRE